ncbi:MAG: hypothetical protein C0507_04060 [Cyanobacteria bacterium PR.3.49]|nr:hypothetical protein [Cyanobacteria bacterium PR.3.49]
MAGLMKHIAAMLSGNASASALKFASASVLTTALVLVQTSPVFAAEKTSGAWMISQDGEGGGPHKTLVTSEGIRSENLRTGVVIAAKAPSWDVTMYNKKSQTYCVMPFSKFQGEMSSRLFGAERVELNSATWKLDGPTQHLGHQLWRYKMASKPKMASKKLGAPFIVKATYWTFRDIVPPVESQQLLSKIYQLPPKVKGLPFRLFIEDASKGWFESLSTTAVVKADGQVVSVDAPKGYVRKKTQDEVMVDPVSKDVFDSFSEWVDPKLDKKNAEKKK